MSRPAPLRIRLLDLHEQVAAAAARDTGGNCSRFVRRALNAYFAGIDAGQLAQVQYLAAEVAGLRRELAPLGSNLNQIARVMNTHDRVEFQALAQAHEGLQRQFSAVMALLQRTEDALRRARG